jgi:ribulose-5-phosphate 4-epimerase/fuculose-1-phosphate aldolase
VSGVAASVGLLREQVALASRILAAEGYADLTLGHLSVRVPGDDVILIKRKGIALDEVEPEDVVEVRLDGREPDGGGAEIHLETVLHTEVYRARRDVGAVVHGHPLHATALAATDADLEPLTHDAVLFHDGIGRFEESADLITAPEQGAAVARALGGRRAVLLRNHGVLVVGRDVPWAVVTAVTLERASRLQSIASALGPLRPLTREYAAWLAPLKYRDPFVEEYWEAWVRRLRRDET